MKTCKFCGSEFHPKQNHPRYKFCSSLCKSRFRSIKDCADGTRQKDIAKRDKVKIRTQQKKDYHNPFSGRKEYVMNKTVERRFLEKKTKALFDSDFTSFVFQEAKRLQVLRKALTGIDWHIDHIVPLKGTNVCGFHVWNNLRVIPKIVNLRKGNKYALHD